LPQSISEIPLKRIDGSADTLAAHRGKVLLIVNVASKCGLTKQYEGLEKLYRAKRDEGFEVLGFPANNFKGQEPGSDAEIEDFCTATYDVDFPMFSKISVLGPDRHPLYAALTATQPVAVGDGMFRERLSGLGLAGDNPSDVLWNFEKFLLDRQGAVIARFSPDIPPDDGRILSAIDAALAK
jgi:glutathione peroxidase